jgi:subtilisin family serine protease
MVRRRALSVGFALVLLVALLPGPAGGVSGGTFSDDNGNTHEGNIEAIAAAGVTQGCAPGLYCPSDNVTRAQMGSFLARAFDLPSASKDYFPDDAGSVHEANINRIAEAGITLGYPDGTYDPNGFVSRAQMASFIARAMGLSPVPGDRFLDVTGIHEPNINAIAEAGVTLGCNKEGTLYCPTDLVRRDQMASFIARALGIDPSVAPTRVTLPPTSMAVLAGTTVSDLLALPDRLASSTSISVESVPGISINFDQLLADAGNALAVTVDATLSATSNSVDYQVVGCRVRASCSQPDYYGSGRLDITVLKPSETPSEGLTVPSHSRLETLPDGSQVATDELVIFTELDKTITPQPIAGLADAVGAVVTGASASLGIYQLAWPNLAAEDLEALADVVSGFPYVRSVTRNILTEMTTSSAGYPNDWDDDGVEGYWSMIHSRARNAWDTVRSASTVRVGIADQGFYPYHGDLQTNVRSSGRQAGTDPLYSASFSSHGTHVAGIACAVGGNATGLVGVAWSCHLNLYDLGGDPDGFNVDTNQLSNWVTNRQLKIVNLSFGEKGTETSTQSYYQLFSAHPNILWVVAAGNNGVSADAYDPASLGWMKNVLTVASVNSDGRLVTNSNRGSVVDLAAPGGRYTTSSASTGVWSTTHSCDRNGNCRSTYGQINGTSMAAPHVTGAAALVAALHPTWSAEKLARCITETTTRRVANDTSMRLLDVAAAVGCTADPAPLPSTSALYINVVPTSGSQSTRFLLESSGFTPNSTVAVRVTNPDGTSYPTTKYQTTRYTDGSGSLTKWLWYWEPGDQYGTYRVTVTDNSTGRKVSDTFTINRPSTSTTLSFRVDPSSCLTTVCNSQSTAMKGVMSGFTPNNSVRIWVYLPDGRDANNVGGYYSYIPTASTNGSGQFTWRYWWDPGMVTGTYRTVIRDNATGRTVSANFSFTPQATTTTSSTTTTTTLPPPSFTLTASGSCPDGAELTGMVAGNRDGAVMVTVKTLDGTTVDTFSGDAVSADSGGGFQFARLWPAAPRHAVFVSAQVDFGGGLVDLAPIEVIHPCTTDPASAETFVGAITTVAASDDAGRVYVASAQRLDGAPSILLRRYLSDGTSDTSWGSSGVAIADVSVAQFDEANRFLDLAPPAVAADGSVFIGFPDDRLDHYLLKFTPTGDVDPHFGNLRTNQRQSDGLILLGNGCGGINDVEIDAATGYVWVLTSGDGECDNTLLFRLDADTGDWVDYELNSGGYNNAIYAEAIAPAPDGGLYFLTTDPYTTNPLPAYIGRIDASGALVTSFGTAGKMELPQTDGLAGPVYTGSRLGADILVSGDRLIAALRLLPEFDVYGDWSCPTLGLICRKKYDIDAVVAAGTTDGQLDTGFGDSGSLYLDLDAAHVEAVPRPPDRSADLALTRAGRIVLMTRQGAGGLITELTADGSVLGSWTVPIQTTSVESSETGVFVVGDLGPNGVLYQRG